MASRASRGLALDPDVLEKFALRARRLGTTQEKEVARALREWLATHEPSPSREGASETEESNREGSPWQLVEDHGFLILEGDIAPDAIPDHRDLRDERIDELIKRSSGESGG